MEGEEERQQIQLQDAARHIVGMLRKALKSPSQNDGAPVQRGQTSGTPGSKRQMVSRPVQPTVSTASRSKLDENMARSFPGLFKKNCSRPRKRAVKSKHVQFFLLDKVTDRTPKTGEEMVLLQAGLGHRTVDIPEDADHSEISALLLESFPKMATLDGAWLLYKPAGGSGQRRLNVVSPEAEGYSGAHLTTGYTGKSCYYIMPIQESLDTSPLPFSAKEFSKMPKAKCINCQIHVPVQLLSLHIQDCQKTDTDSDCEITDDPSEICPICEVPYPVTDLPLHASFCGESSHLHFRDTLPSTSSAASAVQSTLSTAYQLVPVIKEWKSVQDPQEAVQLFLEQLKQEGASQPSLLLSLDATDDDEQRDCSLIKFYKSDYEKSQWKAPFRCSIKGDAAIGAGVTRHVLSSAIARLKHGFKLNLGNAAETLLFEGEPDHLVPAASTVLLESDLFRMAGRILGHSVINGGPTLSGLSRAVVSALTNCQKEMTKSKLCLEDCPDTEQRDTIGLLLKEEWTEEELSRINNLCLDWYCTVPTKDTNKLLIFQQLLSHAVLGRVTAQIKQLQKGIKDTGIWPLIEHRPEVVPLLFPTETEVQLTPQQVLQSIIWPRARSNHDDSDDDMPEETIALLSAFFRRYIEEASSDRLKMLLKFWVGWEVPPQRLKLEFVQSRGARHLPTAATCSERLRLPNHYKKFEELKADLMVCLVSVDTGFGLV
ncbi:uncharacterized protein LOC111196174 isoform X3 [Astyanax mexicanus]|uniref:uncharacterized protein LOC111196174 isoform X3 n=1 Tax=Astyanax mexicanus TaxID=7994 RepID=UPI0020CB4197|nr:uncharacterized protein LOC111196174 isoform X3 [Astyanax mexicanus]